METYDNDQNQQILTQQPDEEVVTNESTAQASTDPTSQVGSAQENWRHIREEQERMKKERVSRIHFDVDPGVDVHVFGSEETKIESIPSWIAVLRKAASVTCRNDRETSVLTGTGLNRRPRCDNTVGRSNGEIAQVLVERVATVHPRRLVEDVGR